MTTISTGQLLAMLASELDAAKAQLEQLGLALTLNPATAALHVRELQALDHVSQRCASVADILRAEDMNAATHAASLESIVDRIEASDMLQMPAYIGAAKLQPGDIDWNF